MCFTITSIISPPTPMLKKEHKIFVIHRKVNHQLGLISLIRRSRPINLITGPVIYSMFFPIVLLDIFVSFYQLTCFPVYKLKKINRFEFIIFDRQQLKYLDWISKFHCTYCAYAVGVIGYVGAVIGSTETYFCPIKHKSKLHSTIKRKQYIDFNNSDDFDFEEKLEKIRRKITSKTH